MPWTLCLKGSGGDGIGRGEVRVGAEETEGSGKEGKREVQLQCRGRVARVGGFSFSLSSVTFCFRSFTFCFRCVSFR